MSRTLKTCLILFFVLIISITLFSVHATEETTETEPEVTSLETEEDVSTLSAEEPPIVEDTTTNPLDTLSTSSITKVSNVNSYDQANLQLNNILSIILIAIGVLLILFAIAILIRLKR